MAGSLRIPATSIEYLKVAITSDVTLTAQPVHFAVVAVGSTPVSGDWTAAAWTGTAGTTRTAVLLIGPGTTTVITEGTYDVYDRVTDNPETPVTLAGRLTIY